MTTAKIIVTVLGVFAIVLVNYWFFFSKRREK
jgi:Tfp pilus assembly protein PilO